jgi:transposase-like protein/IS1 family transposase
MDCPTCNKPAQKFGKNRNGSRRFRCLDCKKTFTEGQQKPLDDMRIPMERALMILQLMVEGMSIRSIERVTNTDKKTILSLLELVGERCEKMLDNLIQGVSVKDVQCDEIWGFVQMKEKTKHRKNREEDTRLGDAYTFVAMEANTKLVLAWHLGRRTAADTFIFTEKLCRATADHSFQINTDGFTPYQDAIVHSLGGKKVNFAQIVKIFGVPEGEEHRYSPPEVIEMQKTAIFGNPDLDKATTSHIERQNLTMRMSSRRLTRLTNAFSKKWLNLKYALALYFAYYNFCRVHKTLRVTPAMEAGLTNHIWTLQEVINI